MGFDFFSIQVFNPRENSKDMMTIDNRQKCELPAEGPPRDWNFTIPFGPLHAHGSAVTVKRFLSAARAVFSL